MQPTPPNPNTAPNPTPPADPAEVANVMRLAHEVQTNPAAYSQLVGDMVQNEPTFYAATEQAAALHQNNASRGSAEHRVLQAALDPSIRQLPNSGHDYEQRDDLFSLDTYLNEAHATNPKVIKDLNQLANELTQVGASLSRLQRIPLGDIDIKKDPNAAAVQIHNQQVDEQELAARIILGKINAILADNPDYSSYLVYKLDTQLQDLTKSSSALDSAQAEHTAAQERERQAGQWDVHVRDGGALAGVPHKDGKAPKEHVSPVVVANRNAAKASIESWHARAALTRAKRHAEADRASMGFVEDVLTNGSINLDLGADPAELARLQHTVDRLTAEFNTAGSDHERYQSKIRLLDFTRQLGAHVENLHERSPSRRDLTLTLNNALAANRRIAYQEADARLENGTILADGRVMVSRNRDGSIFMGDGTDIAVYPDGRIAEMDSASSAAFPGPQPPRRPLIEIKKALTRHLRWDERKNPYAGGAEAPLPEAAPNKYHRRVALAARAAGALIAGTTVSVATEFFDKDTSDWPPYVFGAAATAAIYVDQRRRHRNARRREQQKPIQQRYQKSI